MNFPTRLPSGICTVSVQIASFVSILLVGPALQAEVKMPAIFGDHMVLQRDLGVPFWGSADPAEEVTVSAGGDQAKATAGADGKWALKLGKLQASATPIEVTVAGKNKITFTDVLVGDVWVCSGQSNMEFGIKAFMTPDELAKADEPQIRLFMVPKLVASEPVKDIGPAPTNCPTLGTWQVCSPKTLSSNGEWSGFPAVGFLFGRQIHNFTHQPVGLIGSTWGGTRINSWMSLEALQANPAFKSYAVGAEKLRDNVEQIKKDYAVQLAQYKTDLEKWKEDNKDALAKEKADMEAWQTAKKVTDANHQPSAPRPVTLKPPQEPRDPMGNQNSAGLYNGMIAPIVPYGIKGAIWYQGESNGDQPGFYKLALPAMVTDWRKVWSQGDFPFLVVQLPNFQARKPEPTESTWAGVREAQAEVTSLPNTGYAVTIDLGDAGNIHPPDKFDVAQRLALVGQRVAYDDKQTVTSGPVLKSATVEGNHIRVTFDNVGGGLAIGLPPEHFYVSNKQARPAQPAAQLDGFAVAGADKKYVWAKATIDGDAVVVTSDAVPNPVTVRYAWADNPAANLYNKEGLPAAPFRTDTTPFSK